jgi:hypothetical protein
MVSPPAVVRADLADASVPPIVPGATNPLFYRQ